MEGNSYQPLYQFRCNVKVHSHYASFLQFASNAKNGFYILSLHLTQHLIDAMLQFDTNTNAHANVDAGVNGPLKLPHNIMQPNVNILSHHT